ncbi:MAG: SH3 domain-containing protein [Gallionella sp.]|nr:SH3 domain-containing protein [Gallionella sp.]
MFYLRRYACLLLLLVVGAAQGVEYISVSSDSAVLYDAPSARAKKEFVVSRMTPYEVVVSISGWVKVRDSGGQMYWIESANASPKRYILAMRPVVDVFQLPEFTSGLLFQVGQNVILEWIETTGTGWVKIRHEDGEIGYVRSNDVWGE